MLSSLSNSLKALALYETSVKSILAVQPLKIQLRFKSVEEKLGLPAKPKRPIAPYFRFVKDNRPSIAAKHPNLKSSDINSILGKMWRSLDATDKENFSKGYKTELIEYYSKEYIKYRTSLSDVDKRKVKEMKVEIKKRRILIAKQRKLRKLGKPKKPLTSFLKYYTAQKDRKPNEPIKDYVKRVTDRWNALDETEKEKYNTPAAEEVQYKKALLQWEQKMLKLGHDDVVRVASKQSPNFEQTCNRRIDVGKHRICSIYLHFSANY